jgi:hypothetical protein
MSKLSRHHMFVNIKRRLRVWLVACARGGLERMFA